MVFLCCPQSPQLALTRVKLADSLSDPNVTNIRAKPCPSKLSTLLTCMVAEDCAVIFSE